MKKAKHAILEVQILSKKLTLELRTVCWKDACQNNGKLTREEIEQMNPIIFYSCGYVIRQDKNVVVLAQSYIEDQDKYENILLIPKSLIVED